MLNLVKYLITGLGIVLTLLVARMYGPNHPIIKTDKTENIKTDLTINIIATTTGVVNTKIETIKNNLVRSKTKVSSSSQIKKISTQPVTEKISIPNLSGPEKNSEATNKLSSTTELDLENKSLATTSVAEGSKIPMLLPLDEEALLKSVVKIECPTADGQGKYVGSGFSVKGDVVVTAAHVIKDSGSNNCTVIFSSNHRPVHYLRGAIVDLVGTTKLLDEKGIDFGLLKLPALDSYPEAKAIFPDHYPYIPYPACANPKMLGDKLLHFGYPANYVDQEYLSEQNGEVVAYADIKGIKDQLSEDQTYSFKSPILTFNYDEAKQHPYMVSRVASFYGDSGGLAFNATKQCVLGPHRGGTIGRSAGENFSVFMNVGWEGIQMIIGGQ